MRHFEGADDVIRLSAVGEKHAGEQTGAGWLRDSIQADYALARALAPYLLSRLLRFVPYIKKKKKKM